MVNAARFEDILSAHPFHAILEEQAAVAVAVSGGPDSMALALLLSAWCAKHDKRLHALTVDHGLREEAATESAQVAQWLKGMARHTILEWEGDKPATRLQEEARTARYQLMAEHCVQHNIRALFTAHHQDDQAETVLFRLAKGSGLTGLGGMRHITEYNGLTLLRPLLNTPKQDLISYCESQDQPYFNDPTNTNRDHARPRLRAAKNVLEAEGLTSKRLSTTAQRLQRADTALDKITQAHWKNHAQATKNTVKINLTIAQAPAEIMLRIIIKAIHTLKPNQKHLPRMEKIETLCDALIHDPDFKARTLGGLKFSRDTHVKIEHEF